LRAVSVVDGIAGGTGAWATYYTGLFAPRSDNYRLDGLGPRQWWSAIAPSREEIWLGGREAGMRQMTCLQADGANLPISVPINIWTIQSLLGETRLSRMPFAAEVQRIGDTVTVDIANTSDAAIRGGFVLLEGAYGAFGPVPAGARRAFEVTTRSFQLWQDGEQYQQERGQRNQGRAIWRGLDVPRYPDPTGGQWIRDVFLAQGCLDRTLAMHAYLHSGAALVCVEFADAPPPFTVANRSYDVNHLQYARQLVLPARPGEDRAHD
jgi:hypothetical protein